MAEGEIYKPTHYKVDDEISLETMPGMVSKYRVAARETCKVVTSNHKYVHEATLYRLMPQERGLSPAYFIDTDIFGLAFIHPTVPTVLNQLMKTTDFSDPKNPKLAAKLFMGTTSINIYFLETPGKDKRDMHFAGKIYSMGHDPDTARGGYEVYELSTRKGGAQQYYAMQRVYPRQDARIVDFMRMPGPGNS